MVAEGHAELKSIVDAIPLDFPDVIIDAAGAKHGAGNAGIDGQIARENADALGSGHEDFIFAEQRFELVEEAGELGDDSFGLVEPTCWKVAAAAAQAHV